MEYLSLKTHEKEYCIEPLTFGYYYIAIYDLQKNLISSKTKVDAELANRWREETEKTWGKPFEIVHLST